MIVLLLVLLAALVFEYINGFHDAANAIATVVSTKVLTPRQAVALAASCNMIGALTGTAVAKTISQGLVDDHVVTMSIVLSALLSAIVWNLITWWYGLPSSSSHALVGGLCGSALAAAHGNWHVLKWSVANGKGSYDGLWPKVIFPMFTSPVLGFIMGAILMFLLIVMFWWITPRASKSVFGTLQLGSAGLMGFAHGSNDAQKTMGIIALALYTGTRMGEFDHVPPLLSFLRLHDFNIIPVWIIMSCSLTMAMGTAAGGWRIIKTMGHKIVKLQPVHGCAAETSAALVILSQSFLGIPVSTTHIISTSIMGVGATKRFSAVRWGIVERIVWTWVLTLPFTGLLGYLIGLFLRAA